MSITALVRMRDFSVDISPAINSVVRARDRVQQLIVVCPYFRDGEELCTDWFSLKAQYEEVNNESIIVCSRLDESDIKGKYLLEIDAHVDVSAEGIRLLQKEARESNAKETQAALQSVVVPENFSFAYGYFLVLALLDLWMMLFNFGKHYRALDTRLTAVVSKGSFKYVPRRSFWQNIWNRVQRRPIYEKGTSLARPREGMVFVQHVLRKHESLQFWGLCGFLLGFVMLVVILMVAVSLLSFQDGTPLSSWFFLLTSVGLGLQALTSAWSLSHFYTLPYMMFYVLAYPFYLMTFWLVVISARIT